jgi:hypothetical protein
MKSCPKGCKLHGKPAVMKTGKIVATKKGRKMRIYCPVCFCSEFIEEPKPI